MQWWHIFQKNKSPNTPKTSINILVNVSKHNTKQTIWHFCDCLWHYVSILPLCHSKCDTLLNIGQQLSFFMKMFTAHLLTLMAPSWLHASSNMLHQWNTHEAPLICIWLCDRAYAGVAVYMFAIRLLILQKPNLIKAKLRFYVNK